MRKKNFNPCSIIYIKVVNLISLICQKGSIYVIMFRIPNAINHPRVLNASWSMFNNMKSKPNIKKVVHIYIPAHRLPNLIIYASWSPNTCPNWHPFTSFKYNKSKEPCNYNTSHTNFLSLWKGQLHNHVQYYPIHMSSRISFLRIGK